MSVAQLVRVKEDISTAESSSTSMWTSVFPADIKTEQKSLLFVKKLVAVGISTITYLRGVFPESAYGDKLCEGLHLKMLVNGSSYSGNQLVNWITGAFDAIHKRYLRQLILGFSSLDTPDAEMLETYTFRFSYSADGTASVDSISSAVGSVDGKCRNSKSIQRDTLKMLRAIILLTQSLDAIPADVYLSMRLHYYDQVTPIAYEPPGFRCADSDHYNYIGEPTLIRVGNVSTGFHSVKLRVHVPRDQFIENDFAQEQQQSSQDSGVVDGAQHNVHRTEEAATGINGNSNGMNDVDPSALEHTADAPVVAVTCCSPCERPSTSTALTLNHNGHTPSANENGAYLCVDEGSGRADSTTPVDEHFVSSSFRRCGRMRRCGSAVSAHSLLRCSPPQALPRPQCMTTALLVADACMDRAVPTSSCSDRDRPVIPTLTPARGAADSMRLLGDDEETPLLTSGDALHQGGNDSTVPSVTPRLRGPGSVCSTTSSCSLRSVSVVLAPSRPSPGFPVRCPCSVHADDGLMILCDVCGYWQHGACFSILSERAAPHRHVCQLCSDPPSLCTDPRLCALTPRKLSSTCLFRRCLSVLNAEDAAAEVTTAGLAHRLGVNVTQATALVNKLRKLGALYQPTHARLRSHARNLQVDREFMQTTVIPQFFCPKDQQNLSSTDSDSEEQPRPRLGPSQEWGSAAKRHKSSLSTCVRNTDKSPPA